MAKPPRAKTAIAGLVIAAAVGASCGILANVVWRGGADAGDWLQFFGGALGAGLTVLGTLYLSNFQERRVRDAERAIMVELARRFEANLIRTLLDDAALSGLGEANPEGLRLYAFGQLANTGALFERFKVGEHVRSWQTIMALNRVQRLLNEYRPPSLEAAGGAALLTMGGGHVPREGVAEDLLDAARQLLHALNEPPTKRRDFVAVLQALNERDLREYNSVMETLDD